MFELFFFIFDEVAMPSFILFGYGGMVSR